MSSVAPWSYSKLKKFENCPKQFYHTVVTKEYVETFASEAMLYGTDFHTAAEHYLRDDTDIPERFEFARPMLDALGAKKGARHCELKMGVTEDLDPCDFFASNVWWRGVVDLLIVDGGEAYVVDYKTGASTKYADVGQLELMAMAVFKRFPEIKKIRAGLLYVITEDLIRETYTIEDAPDLWLKWLKRFNRMVAAEERGVWNPRPSGLCKKHCVVLSCPHNGANT